MARIIGNIQDQVLMARFEKAVNHHNLNPSIEGLAELITLYETLPAHLQEWADENFKVKTKNLRHRPKRHRVRRPHFKAHHNHLTHKKESQHA